MTRVVRVACACRARIVTTNWMDPLPQSGPLLERTGQEGRASSTGTVCILHRTTGMARTSSFAVSPISAPARCQLCLRRPTVGPLPSTRRLPLPCIKPQVTGWLQSANSSLFTVGREGQPKGRPRFSSVTAPHDRGPGLWPNASFPARLCHGTGQLMTSGPPPPSPPCSHAQGRVPPKSAC